MVQAVVVDDQVEVRSALKLLLEESAGINDVAQAASLDELLAIVHNVTPNLILLDWDLAGKEPGRLISLLRKLDGKMSILALDSSPHHRPAAIGAGADYFVCKGEPPEKLLSVISEIRSKMANKQGGKNVQD